MQDLTRQLQQQMTEKIETLVAEMPVGSVLCVHHDPEFTATEADGGEITLSVSQSIHVFDPLKQVCSVKVPKTLYGPK